MSVKYTSIRESISQHIDRLVGLFEQLQVMATKIDDKLSVGILVALIQVTELTPVSYTHLTLPTILLV